MLPKINQQVKLIELSNFDNRKMLKSNIADLSQDSITITYPVEENGGLPRLLSKNAQVIMIYNGKDECQYEFSTIVIGRRKENIPLYILARPKESTIKRRQRREYFRVPTNLRVDVQIQSNVQSKPFAAVTMDLSGGGMTFVCNNSINIKQGGALTCTIMLPDTDQTKSIQVIAEIIRLMAPQDRHQHQRVSVKFIKMRELDRDIIIRYCYGRQLELRKKGLM
jgi:c-di-GMP-binding flagellar brake protein YcgR